MLPQVCSLVPPVFWYSRLEAERSRFSWLRYVPLKWGPSSPVPASLKSVHSAKPKSFRAGSFLSFLAKCLGRASSSLIKGFEERGAFHTQLISGAKRVGHLHPFSGRLQGPWGGAAQVTRLPEARLLKASQNTEVQLHSSLVRGSEAGFLGRSALGGHISLHVLSVCWQMSEERLIMVCLF